MDGKAGRRAPRFVYLTDATGRSARFAWRLDAANHRPLARAVDVQGSLGACRTAAARLRSEIDAAAAGVVFERADGAWIWRLPADRRVAACLHAYARRVECQRAFDHFVDAVRAADPLEGVVRDFGPRTLRDFAEPAS